LDVPNTSVKVFKLNASSVLKRWSAGRALVALGAGLFLFGAFIVFHVRHRSGSNINLALVAAGFAVVESRRVSLRIGKEALVYRFMEIPLCFGLVLLAPWQLLVARLIGSGAVLGWRQRNSPSRATFNIGYFAFETASISFLSGRLLSAQGRLGILLALAAVEIACAGIMAIAVRLAGQRVPASETLHGAVISFVMSLMSALTGLVLVAAWQQWPFAVIAIVPFGALFLKSWRGEIERSRKADALAALSQLTAELTASTPGEASIADFSARLGDLARTQRVVVAVGSTVYRWASDALAVMEDAAIPAVAVPGGLTVDSERVLLGTDELVAARHASFQAGSLGTGWLVLGEPVVGTEFNAETDSIAETVADRLGAWFSNAALIDDLRGEVAEREYLAFHDPLTDLPNRRRFRDVFDDTLAAGNTGGLILVALDHFSLINDSVGHQQGDEALAQIAQRLRDVVPESALLSRLGGDEFGILIPASAQLTMSLRQRAEFTTSELRLEQFQVGTVADAILAAIVDPPLLLAGMSFAIGASAGIATFPADGTDPSELLRQADQALQSAKAQRGTKAFYSPERHGRDHDQVTLLGELRRAIDENEMILHYQPKIDLPSGGALVGVEALVRWNHPTRGLVYPDDFVPVAEHYDLLNDLFFYVVEAAARQLRNWTAEGFEQLGVAVNLSARNLRAPNLARRVSRLVDAYGIDPARLTLELTETALMADSDHAMKTLRTLRDQSGVEIAVDDFGVGLSSIAYLRDLPASEVKIDKTFCNGLPGDSANEAIVRAIHQLASSLGRRVTVEGVETEATYEFLRSIGIDRAQGYWIARPMPADELQGWWTQNQARLRPRPRRVVSAAR
jgi:diguanylate cyclase (GGDEF)-like protein